MDRIPTIEEEFAELDAELKRIAALPVQTPEQRNALLVTLESLRADWMARGQAAEAPAWRKTVDAAVANAFDSLIGELSKNPDTNFQLDQSLLQAHLRPVFLALADGLKQNLVEKFGKRPPPGQAAPKVDGADVAGMLLTLFGPPKKK